MKASVVQSGCSHKNLRTRSCGSASASRWDEFHLRMKLNAVKMAPVISDHPASGVLAVWAIARNPAGMVVTESPWLIHIVSHRRRCEAGLFGSSTSRGALPYSPRPLLPQPHPEGCAPSTALP